MTFGKVTKDIFQLAVAVDSWKEVITSKQFRKDLNHEKLQDHQDADLVVVNTCNFPETACTNTGLVKVPYMTWSVRLGMEVRRKMANLVPHEQTQKLPT